MARSDFSFRISASHTFRCELLHARRTFPRSDGYFLTPIAAFRTTRFMARFRLMSAWHWHSHLHQRGFQEDPATTVLRTEGAKGGRHSHEAQSPADTVPSDGCPCPFDKSPSASRTPGLFSMRHTPLEIAIPRAARSHKVRCFSVKRIARGCSRREVRDTVHLAIANIRPSGRIERKTAFDTWAASRRGWHRLRQLDMVVCICYVQTWRRKNGCLSAGRTVA